MIRVLLVDDHTLLRQGTRALLGATPEIEVVAEAALGREALELAARLRPDVVLLDIRLPDLSGIEVARTLRQDLPAIKVVILTAYAYEQYVRALFAIGVHGYLLKNAGGAELIAAVRAVQAGEQVLGTEIAALLAATRRHGSGVTGTISDREREVLGLVARGASNKEIAARLGISARTVETHVSNAMAKLDAHSRAEALSVAMQRGIIDPPD